MTCSKNTVQLLFESLVIVPRWWTLPLISVLSVTLVSRTPELDQSGSLWHIIQLASWSYCPLLLTKAAGGQWSLCWDKDFFKIRNYNVSLNVLNVSLCLTFGWFDSKRISIESSLSSHALRWGWQLHWLCEEERIPARTSGLQTPSSSASCPAACPPDLRPKPA